MRLVESFCAFSQPGWKRISGALYAVFQPEIGEELCRISLLNYTASLRFSILYQVVVYIIQKLCIFSACMFDLFVQAVNVIQQEQDRQRDMQCYGPSLERNFSANITHPSVHSRVVIRRRYCVVEIVRPLLHFLPLTGPQNWRKISLHLAWLKRMYDQKQHRSSCRPPAKSATAFITRYVRGEVHN